MNTTNHPRKTPTPGRARKLFIRHPFRRDVEWATYWDVSPERARQVREAAGVPASHIIAEAARAFIRTWEEPDDG